MICIGAARGAKLLGTLDHREPVRSLTHAFPLHLNLAPHAPGRRRMNYGNDFKSDIEQAALELVKLLIVWEVQLSFKLHQIAETDIWRCTRLCQRLLDDSLSALDLTYVKFVFWHGAICELWPWMVRDVMLRHRNQAKNPFSIDLCLELWHQCEWCDIWTNRREFRRNAEVSWCYFCQLWKINGIIQRL